MNIVRLGVSLVLGVCITFLLFVLMYTLIDAGFQEKEDKGTTKVADIWQPEREITENVKDLKPEKPEEPQEPPPDLPDQTVEFEAPENALSIAAPKVGGTQIGVGGGFAKDSDYIPVYVPQPQYPRRAQTRGVSGYAVVEVVITTTGGVRDPQMLEEYPEGYGFGRAAVKAATKLKYNPRVVDGVPEEVPGVLYKFSFNIEQ
ncbi:MAG: energy transducer TonB [bacterium]